MTSNERFHDNPSGVITDSANAKDWLPKDSYQDLGKWSNWLEAQSYILLMKQVYAGGFSDWRMPTKEEALSLFDEDHTSLDWESNDVHIATVFVPKCSYYLWTSDVNENDQALRVDLRDGSSEYVDKSLRDQHATRLIRDKS